MPCAPASRQILAQRMTSGMFSWGRVLRSVAILLTFTESLVIRDHSASHGLQDFLDQLPRAADVADGYAAETFGGAGMGESDFLGDECYGARGADAGAGGFAGI